MAEGTRASKPRRPLGLAASAFLFALTLASSRAALADTCPPLDTACVVDTATDAAGDAADTAADTASDAADAASDTASEASQTVADTISSVTGSGGKDPGPGPGGGSPGDGKPGGGEPSKSHGDSAGSGGSPGGSHSGHGRTSERHAGAPAPTRAPVPGAAPGFPERAEHGTLDRPAAETPGLRPGPPLEQEPVTGGVGRRALEVARHLGFPLALAVLVLTFVLIHTRIDRRDPKLALAPADTRQEDLGFD